MPVPDETIWRSVMMSWEEAWRGGIDPKVAGRSTCVGDIGVHAQQLIASVTGLCMDEIWADMNVIREDRVLDTNTNVIVRYKGESERTDLVLQRSGWKQ